MLVRKNKNVASMNKKEITSLIVGTPKTGKKKIKAIGIIHIHAIISAGIK